MRRFVKYPDETWEQAVYRTWREEVYGSYRLAPVPSEEERDIVSKAAADALEAYYE